MKIKKDDTVRIIAGRDGGKEGKVKGTIPSKNQVVVENRNMVTCHVKARRQGEESAIIEREAPIAVCKVQLICPKCGKPTRVGMKRVKKIVSGKEKLVGIRVCKKCGAEEI